MLFTVSELPSSLESLWATRGLGAVAAAAASCGKGPMPRAGEQFAR